VKVTEAHEALARYLAAGPHLLSGPPAFRWYLAAVERISLNQSSFMHSMGLENSFFRYSHWAVPGAGFVEGMLEDPGDGEIEFDFTPEEARERAFELLVLADVAEGAEPPGGFYADPKFTRFTDSELAWLCVKAEDEADDDETRSLFHEAQRELRQRARQATR
jgi:hypothetical protein